MKGTECKRMLVRAFGINVKESKTAYAENRNFNAEGCTDEPGKCGCTHAEINLLLELPNPDVVVVSHSPCINCAKSLVEAKVKVVTYMEEYRIRDGIEYLEKNGVKVVKGA